MKIAIFTDTFFPDMNGVARTLKRFTNYLDDYNLTYKIFAPENSTSQYGGNQIHRLKSLPFFLYPECRLAIPSLFDLSSKLQDFSPDVIHVATPFSIGLCGVYLAKKYKIPLVGSYHTNFDEYLKYYNLSFLTKILWKYMHWFHSPCQKLFVPSVDTYQQLKQQGFRNLELWPRGVDCQLFHPNHEQEKVQKLYCPSEKFLLTFVGRLAPEKDIQTLLTVARNMPGAINEKLQWLIIGDGPLRDELEAQAPNNMTFTGYLDGQSLAEIYSASDLFVFPSPTETFGNVVLEALASGTPVIGANAGGVKNIIKSGQTGYLCTPGNVEEFTSATLRLLNNAALRKQMAIAGRMYALTQRWDEIFKNLICHYTDVIDASGEQKYA
ncbi:glycosyltransferase family 1 protein [Bacillus sp. 1P10SD]|uniref:glycosyltransferase family 4 protein n=1 Tax=Bacillus sp. 1P10SD TaxID=3132265 RepID=UPI0039A65C00